MNREIIYSGQLPLSATPLNNSKHALKALGQLINDLMLSSATTAAIAGLALTAQSPESMSLNLGPGAIYQPGQVDNVTSGGSTSLQPFGSETADSTTLPLQGISYATQAISGFAAPTTSGQSINYLVEFQVQVQDATPVVLNYYNSSNPKVPYVGPNGAGTSQNTQRLTVLAYQVVAGTAATTGSQTTPATTAGWLPGYVVTVAYGATTLGSGNIAVATNAPFLAPLTASHHNGSTGQAPKIQLTSATEVQGVLPAANQAPISAPNWADLACTAGAGLSLSYTGISNLLLGNSVVSVTANAITLTASATNYVYVNSSGVVTSNTTGFPTSGAYFPMATVVTGASSYTQANITDKRTWGTGASSSVAPPTGLRNCVLGAPSTAYLTGSGAALTAGYTGPLDVTFANGFNSSGLPLDSTVQLATNASFWTGLTASATNYLFIDYGGGTPTGVASTLAPVFANTAPSTPASGQYWYNPSTGVSQVYTTSWGTVQRAWVGSVVTNATNVTSESPAAANSLFIGGNINAPGGSRVRAHQSSAQSVSSGTWTKIQFQTIDQDNLGEFDNVTNYRFTAKQAGEYQVSSTVYLGAFTGAQYAIMSLYVNGTAYAQLGSISPYYTTSGQFPVNGSTRVHLNAGDYVEIYLETNFAATLIASNSSQTWVDVNKVA